MKFFTKKISIFSLLFLPIFFACTLPNENPEKTPIKIAFVDAFQDETLAQARIGFWEGLALSGFSEKKGNIQVFYQNAQGDLSTLHQALDYSISQKPTLLAVCPTLAEITAVKKQTNTPICSMVTSDTKLTKLIDKNGQNPPNLFGAYDNTDHIADAMSMTKKLFPNAKKIGLLYSQAEIQSKNALEIIQKRCEKENLQLFALPVNNSNETDLVTQALVQKNIDIFFALPDNAVFSSFEVIYKRCENAKIPILTCEEGLVKRGALAAYGANMYEWGKHAGEIAGEFLKTGKKRHELIKSHRFVYNSEVAKAYNMQFSKDFVAVKNEKTTISNNSTKETENITKNPENLSKKPQNNQQNTQNTLNFYLSAVVLALCLGGLVWGIFLSMRIFDIPDITTDGSYTLGAVVTAVLLSYNIHWGFALGFSLVFGGLAGFFTGFIHTKFKVQALLSGILVMTALYSVNLEILGRSNLAISQENTVFALPNALLGIFSPLFYSFLVLFLANLLLSAGLWYILKSDWGLTMRALGNSESMVRANGASPALLKIQGLMLANALTALSGSFLAQYQGFSDINMGGGMVIIGLASVMIGESMLTYFKFTKKTIASQIFSVILGAILFRMLLAVVLMLGINPNWFKFLTAVVVLLVVSKRK